MYCVYVLCSLKNGKRYIGVTSRSVEIRLQQHNSGTDDWTRRNGPFALIYTEAFDTKQAAQRRERFLKSGHGRQFLNQRIPR